MTETKNNPKTQQKEENAEKTLQLGSLKVNKTLAYSVIGAVLAIGIFVCIKNFYITPKNEKAQTQFAKSLEQRPMLDQQLQAILQEVQAAEYAVTNPTDSTQAGAQDSLNVKVENYKKAKAEVYNKALKGDGKNPGLLKIAEESSTSAGNIACAEAGICYFKMGNYKEAIKYLEQFSPQGDQGISPQYLAALANCYAADKQVEKAIETFKEAAKEASNPALSPLYLREAGKLLESQKKNEEALKIYEQIKSEYPTSSLVITQQGPNGLISQIEQDITRVSK